jgi:hypothetical protein
MSFEYLVKKYCELDENKNNPECGCFTNDVGSASNLVQLRGKQTFPSVKASDDLEIYSQNVVYNPKCLMSNNEFTNVEMKNAKNSLKTCSGIYDFTGGGVKSVFESCPNAEGNSYLRGVSYACTPRTGTKRMKDGDYTYPQEQGGPVDIAVKAENDKNPCPKRSSQVVGIVVCCLLIVVFFGIIVVGSLSDDTKQNIREKTKRMTNKVSNLFRRTPSSNDENSQRSDNYTPLVPQATAQIAQPLQNIVSSSGARSPQATARTASPEQVRITV